MKNPDQIGSVLGAPDRGGQFEARTSQPGSAAWNQTPDPDVGPAVIHETPTHIFPMKTSKQPEVFSHLFILKVSFPQSLLGTFFLGGLIHMKGWTSWLRPTGSSQ